jgi:hypothetical protein
MQMHDMQSEFALAFILLLGCTYRASMSSLMMENLSSSRPSSIQELSFRCVSSMYVCMFVYKYVCVRVCVCIYMYVYIYIYIYIYIYTH